MVTNTDRGVESRGYDYTTRKAYYNSMIMSQKEINLRDVEGVPQSNGPNNCT